MNIITNSLTLKYLFLAIREAQENIALCSDHIKNDTHPEYFKKVRDELEESIEEIRKMMS